MRENARVPRETEKKFFSSTLSRRPPASARFDIGYRASELPPRLSSVGRPLARTRGWRELADFARLTHSLPSPSSVSSYTRAPDGHGFSLYCLLSSVHPCFVRSCAIIRSCFRYVLGWEPFATLERKFCNVGVLIIWLFVAMMKKFSISPPLELTGSIKSACRL